MQIANWLSIHIRKLCHMAQRRNWRQRTPAECLMLPDLIEHLNRLVCLSIKPLLEDARNLLQHHSPALMRSQFTPFPTRLAIHEARKRVVSALFNTCISGKDNRALVASKVPVEPMLAPPRPVIADDGFVVVAEYSSVCDFLHRLRQGGLDVEFLVHGAWDGEDALAAGEDLAGCCCDCDVVAVVDDGGDGGREVDVACADEVGDVVREGLGACPVNTSTRELFEGQVEAYHSQSASAGHHWRRQPESPTTPCCDDSSR